MAEAVHQASDAPPSRWDPPVRLLSGWRQLDRGTWCGARWRTRPPQCVRRTCANPTFSLRQELKVSPLPLAIEDGVTVPTEHSTGYRPLSVRLLDAMRGPDGRFKPVIERAE